MARSLVFAFFLCVCLGSAQAVELREIELRDGTVLRGEIVSLENGNYTIRSSSLGEIRVPASDVRVIRFPPAPPVPPSIPHRVAAPDGATPRQGGDSDSADVGQQVEDLRRSGDLHGQLEGVQQSLGNDDSIMEIIQSLQDDPELKAVLNDPEIMQAVQAGDVQALMANPKFMALLNNPKIQEIQRRSADR